MFYPGTYEKVLQYAKDAEHTSHPESSQSEKEGFRKKGNVVQLRFTAPTLVKVYINYKCQTPFMRLVVQLIYN